MPSEYVIDDPGRFLSQVESLRNNDDLFQGLYEEVDDRSIAGLRRRRGRAVNSLDSPVKTVALVEEDGVLYWRDGIPARKPVRRGGRRAAAPAAEGSLVLVNQFPTLAPNKVVAAIGAIDRRLNPAIEALLCSRLRPLRRNPDGSFVLDNTDATGPFDGRTLLFVHGTFSNAANMLGEFARPDGPGLRFLNQAMQGGSKYDRILFFDHPTLAVSPVINALELGRAFAGSSGQIDVIAHSRGGLVVRWWLEAFGGSLRVAANARVRALLAGSPLHGTSLAAPDKIQHAMSLVSNIGSFAEKTLGLIGVANPFLWVASKLIEVIVSVTGALAHTPLVDAVTALIPGLAGQSAVENNHELNRLRTGPVAVDPLYYAVKSNFEPADPGWKFWRYFRADYLGDLAADAVFRSDNDLVVDTWSMSDFGVPNLVLAAPAYDFGTSPTVWHCNYFRQPETIGYLAANFGVALN